MAERIFINLVIVIISMPIDHDFPLPGDHRLPESDTATLKREIRNKIYLSPNVNEIGGAYYFDCTKDPKNWSIHGRILRLKDVVCYSNGEGTFGTSIHAPYGSIHYDIIRDDGQDVNSVPDNRADVKLQETRQFSGPYRTPKKNINLADILPIPIPPIPIPGAEVGGMDEWLDYMDWQQENAVIYTLNYLSGGLYNIPDNANSIILKIWESDPLKGCRDELLAYQRIQLRYRGGFSFSSRITCFEFDGNNPRCKTGNKSLILNVDTAYLP
jgi:hypothetical protein